MFSELSNFTSILSGLSLDQNLSLSLDQDQNQSLVQDEDLDQVWSRYAHQALSPGGHRVVSVFLGSIMVLGFTNNLLVLVLFWRFKALRTPVNLMLLNISLSDMLVCVCGTTLSFLSSLQRRWLYGRTGCLWYGFINSCFGIVSLVSLAVLSYERYSTLMVSNQRLVDYRKPLLAVGGSWLYSVAWTVPPLLGWSSYGPEGAGTSCSVTWTDRSASSHAYIVCLFVFCLGLPVAVMVYCYGRLLHAVKQVGRFRRTAARRREFHILFMVVTTVACYLLCWMPYGVVAMMATFGRPGAVSPIAAVVPSILAKSSTVINPVIYILMNKQFYRCFLVLFHCEVQQPDDAHPSMPSKTTLVQLTRRPRPNAAAAANATANATASPPPLAGHDPGHVEGSSTADKMTAAATAAAEPPGPSP